ncbi:MAG: YhdP family protein, partial [Aeromonadaceae bacterium]
MRRLASHAWLLLGIFLFILALAISVARWGVPWLQEQRTPLLRAIIPDPSIQLDISGLGVTWSHYGPRLALEGLALHQTGSKPWQLTVQQADLRLDPWQSLVQRRWVVSELQFSGVDLTLSSALLSREGATAQKESDWRPLVAWLLEDLHAFSLQRSTLHVRSAVGALSSLQVESLRWQNQTGRHQGEGKLTLSHQGVSKPVHLIADFRGDGHQPEQLAGSLYLATQPLAAPHPAPQTKPDPLQLDFQLWLERAQGAWQLALLQLGDNRVRWGAGERPHELALRGGSLQWLRLDEGWQLAAHQLAVQSDVQAWHPWSLQLDYRQAQLSGRVDPISLGAIAPLMALLAGDDSPQAKAMQAMQPSGLISALAFSRHDSDGSWRVEGQLDKLSWHRWQMIPGVCDLQGSFSLGAEGGSAQLALGPQTLGVGPYFPKDIPISALTANLSWVRQADGWQLSGQGVQLVTPALEASTDFRLTLPAHDSPYLALLAQVDLHDAGQAWRYYPRLAMGESLTHYLTQALQHGEANGATILWDGALSDFPYHQGSGVFQAWVPLRQARFQFDTAWRPLSDLSLDLLFANDTLEMKSQSASLGAAHSDYIHAWFPTLAEDSVLYINADVAGEAQAVSDYLIHSGVKDSVGSALEALPITKPLRGDLQLAIPINGEPVKVLGHVQFADNNLLVKQLRLPLEKVQGELFFTERQTRFDNLQAELWQQPVRLDYLGEQNGEAYRVKLGVHGRWEQARATNWSQGWRDTLQGATSWQGRLDLRLQPKGHFTYQAELASDLKGLALELPPPYDKLAIATQPLRIVARGESKESRVRVDWDNGLRLESRFDHAGQRFSRFWLTNQDEQQHPFTPAPVSINLAFDRLDLDAWLAWWQDFSQDGTGEQVAAAPALLPGQQAYSFSANSVELASQPWDKVLLSGNREENRGRIGIQGNQIAGALVWQPKQPWQLTLAYLNWREPSPAATAGMPPSLVNQLLPPERMPSVAEQRAQLATIPALDLVCQLCQWNDAKLGEVKLQLRPQPNALQIPHFSLRNGSSLVQGEGQWQVRGQEASSHIDAKLSTRSLESLLQAWGVGQG